MFAIAISVSVVNVESFLLINIVLTRGQDSLDTSPGFKGKKPLIMVSFFTKNCKKKKKNGKKKCTLKIGQKFTP